MHNCCPFLSIKDRSDTYHNVEKRRRHISMRRVTASASEEGTRNLADIAGDAIATSMGRQPWLYRSVRVIGQVRGSIRGLWQQTPCQLCHTASTGFAIDYNEHICDFPAEPLHTYKLGGYHPVHIEDLLDENRYKVLHKLRWGGYSTVWAARDQRFGSCCCEDNNADQLILI